MNIGDRLRKIRGSMSQQEFADILQVHRNTVARYERNERTPDVDYFNRICEKTKVSSLWLLTGEGDPFPDKLSEKSETLEIILTRYNDAGVVPKLLISEEEITIIKCLRLVTDYDAMRIIDLIREKLIEDKKVDKYVKILMDSLSSIVKRHKYEKGIDLDYLVWKQKEQAEELKKLDKKISDNLDDRVLKNLDFILDKYLKASLVKKG